MANQPYPGEDIIDSRDIIAFIDERESDLESLNDEIEEVESEISDIDSKIEDFEEEIELLQDSEDEDEIEEREEAEKELGALEDERSNLEERLGCLKDDAAEIEEELGPYRDLAEQAEGYGDWRYGEALINEDYFEEYAQQLAEDIGAVNSEMAWPCDHIDWEAAADALKIDYMTVTFAGVDYLMRC